MNGLRCFVFLGLFVWFANGRAGEASSLPDAGESNFTVVAEQVRQRAEAAKPAVMTAYTNQIPGGKASYAMMPIPAGEFLMGSFAGNRRAAADEFPAHRVKLAAFWMGKCEVTWDEFNAYVYDDIEQRQNSPPPKLAASNPGLADAVTHPTLPYVDMDFGMGKRGFPAIAMTQHAANKYCQWLSAKTGHFYRLPTEAEWEYAARAGTTNTWSFGDEETRLADFAWFEDNSNFKYQKVGRKLPNAWGLHDLLGNVSEWVLDQHDASFYRQCAGRGEVIAPWNRAEQPHPLVVRGGSWRDSAAALRCAARGQSTPDWKTADPQMPKSVFWLRSCDFVGFRIVRPLPIPTVEEMRRYWNNCVERE